MNSLGNGSSSIATRLGLAFGLVAATTVAAALIGWISFARIANNQREITNVHLPSTVSAAAFAEQGSALAAIAPALAQATSLEDVQKLQTVINERLKNLTIFVVDQNDRLPSTAITLVSSLRLNINALSETVQRRLVLRQQAITGFGELRWLHADILDEAEPLITEARVALRQSSAQNATSNPNRLSLADLDRIDALTDVVAQANLAAGLLARISTAADIAEFSQTVYFLSETTDALTSRLARLEKNAEYATLLEVTERLLMVASLKDGLPGFRRDELKQLELMQGHLEINRALVVSGGVGFGYVRRNIVARISTMAAAGRALAAGAEDVIIPAGGNDELSDMGKALVMYRASSAKALTAERLALEQLKTTQAGLVQSAKLAALGQLSAGVGHELNQPIAAIRSFAHNGQILLERNQPKDAGHTLKRIEELTFRMSAIVGHLKRFARRPDQTLKAICLHDCVQDALSLFENRLKDRDIKLLTFVDAKLMVEAESVRLEQIIVNLVSNALDAVEGHESAAVTIAGRQEKGVVTLSVTDSGAGIAPADQSAIFDPFFTTKASGSGLGLGLSTSFNIARDFNGVLRLAQSSAQGTVFELTLNSAAIKSI